MIRNNINQSSFSNLYLHIDKHDFKITGKVRKGFTSSQFGYGIMERSHDGNYEVTFHMWHDNDNTVRPLNYSVSIPKGPRKSNHTSPSKKDLKAPMKKSFSFLPFSILLIVLACCATTKFSIGKWFSTRRMRRTYEPIYEMEPVHSR
jgi:hypothetical protein